MAKLFGFSIDDNDDLPKGVVSPIPQTGEDGVDYYIQSGFSSQVIDLEGIYKDEHQSIKKYREMALHPEVDNAVEDIVNEAIVSDTNDSPVEIDLENLNASDGIKDKIRVEFKHIKDLLDFDSKSHEIFRNWYVDGRIYYNKVIDIKKPQDGIQELRYIDPMKMRYVRKEQKQNKERSDLFNASPNVHDNDKVVFPKIEEYFMYTPTPRYPTNMIQGSAPHMTGVKLAKDSITYCTSGLVDRNKGTCLSYLHKAIKALNQLRMIEDSLVIYRLSRAPERRIFYIDVGNLPKIKAEQYLRDVMSRYRNKLVYDSKTGETRDDKKYMSMLEDFWLPRREGGRGTEITTLPGGQNLGELADIEYFQSKLYRSLGVPESRIAGSGDGFNLGRSSEILRDELKFSKFVGRLRKRFGKIFLDMLRTQLLLKNIVTPDDWEVMSEHIQFDFIYDNHFAELKDKELMEGRLGLLGMVEPYVGRYYSTEYVRRQVLRQRDQEIVEIDEQIEDEIAKGIIPDPNQQMLELEQGAAMGMEMEDPNAAMGELPPTKPETAAKLPKPGANEGEI
jgi:hypothetical protein|tara:strand:- start:1886 stop:3568 length:1683 start_codon:yes stop_codon:yes gene_type:complete